MASLMLTIMRPTVRNNGASNLESAPSIPKPRVTPIARIHHFRRRRFLYRSSLARKTAFDVGPVGLTFWSFMRDSTGLKVDQPRRHNDEIVRLQEQVLVGLPFLEDFDHVQFEILFVGAVLPAPDDLHFFLVGKIAKTAGPQDRPASRQVFVHRNIDRSLVAHLA